MRVVAMVSGGKDSCYNMMQCVAEGFFFENNFNQFPTIKMIILKVMRLSVWLICILKIEVCDWIISILYNYLANSITWFQMNWTVTCIKLLAIWALKN